MNDYSEKVERLLEQLEEDSNIALPYASLDVLVAIDSLCRVMLGIVSHELTDKDWSRLSTHKQKEILYAYRELGRQAERLADHLCIGLHYFGKGQFSEIDSLQHNSGIAQYIASMHVDSGKLDPKIMKSLTEAALYALSTTQPLLEKIKRAQYAFYNGSLSRGLIPIERLVA